MTRPSGDCRPGSARRLSLRYLVDLPEVDVALAMGCTVGKVKSSTSLGLDALRARLGVRWAVE